MFTRQNQSVMAGAVTRLGEHVWETVALMKDTQEEKNQALDMARQRMQENIRIFNDTLQGFIES